MRPARIRSIGVRPGTRAPPVARPRSLGSRHAMERALSQRPSQAHGTQALDNRSLERGSPDQADEAAMTAILDTARPHADGAIVESDIPARLERLPWGRFHTLVV